MQIIQSPDQLSYMERVGNKTIINFGQHLVTVNTLDEDGNETETQMYEIFREETKGRIPTIRERKLMVKNAIEYYDTSSAVNAFYLSNGGTAWLDKATRLGLVHSISVEKAKGNTTFTLWLNGKSYSLDIDYLSQFLNDLEEYAMATYNVTQSHLAYVTSAKPDTYFEYDFTQGYPDKITLNTHS